MDPLESPAPKTPKGRGVGEPRAEKDSRKIKVAKEEEARVTGMSEISRSDGSTHSVDTKMA